MTSPRHEGEQAVQRRAGEGGEGWGSPMFGARISHGFARFLAAQRMLIVGAEDANAAPWCTLIAGPAGFADAVDDRTVVIAGLPALGDPLRDAFDVERDVGVLAIEPQHRRRIRLNGRARQVGGTLVMRTEQVLGNCPKYIQTRDLDEGAAAEAERGGVSPARWGTELDEAQQRLIAQADTFFIASRAPEHGADASHRGGAPGFVTLDGGRRLRWPDYFGNSFYMTLGNIELNPACGLLFVDWEHGDTLQLTGRARIDWDQERARAVPGALRLVEFDLDRVVQIPAASPLRWRFQFPSQYNPPVAEFRS